jgi:hypothetical protein
MLGYRKLLKDKCEMCGDEPGKFYLQIHHKDKNRKNNEPENLATLCRYCHCETHSELRKISGGLKK